MWRDTQFQGTPKSWMVKYRTSESRMLMQVVATTFISKPAAKDRSIQPAAAWRASLSSIICLLSGIRPSEKLQSVPGRATSES